MAACSSVPVNASVTVISVENGVPEALEYNICQHLLDAGLIEKR
jgi:hypothetical protein